MKKKKHFFFFGNSDTAANYGLSGIVGILIYQKLMHSLPLSLEAPSTFCCPVAPPVPCCLLTLISCLLPRLGLLSVGSDKVVCLHDCLLLDSLLIVGPIRDNDGLYWL